MGKSSSSKASASWRLIWKRSKKFSLDTPLVAWERDLFLVIGQRVGTTNGPVLSAGCGRAKIEYWLARVLGVEVHLLDSASHCLSLVRKAFEKIPHFRYCESILDMSFDDDTFVVVENEGVLEHFDRQDLHQALREMARVSEKWVIVDVPYAGSRPYMLAKEWLEKKGKWSFGYEDPRMSLQDEFKDVGLRVVEERLIGNRQTNKNYVNMIDDPEARQEVLSKLTEKDFDVYPHLLTVGLKKDD